MKFIDTPLLQLMIKEGHQCFKIASTQLKITEGQIYEKMCPNCKYKSCSSIDEVIQDFLAQTQTEMFNEILTTLNDKEYTHVRHFKFFWQKKMDEYIAQAWTYGVVKKEEEIANKN